MTLKRDGLEQQGAQPGAACAVASTRVSLSETEDETITTLETMQESFATGDWAGSAQVAALANALAALTLAGALVTNTSVEEVVQSPRKVVTITTFIWGQR